MRIGVDASRVQVTGRTGTETYNLEMIRHLIPLAAAEGHALWLYTRGPLDPRWFGLETWPEHVHVRPIHVPRLWTHLGLATVLYRDPPDVLFIPAHVVPWRAPRHLPIAVTVHDLGYEVFPKAHPRRQRWYLRWSTRHSVRRARRVFADSHATADDLVRFYRVPREKITVVYPALPAGRGQPVPGERVLAVRQRYGLTGPYFLFVGTLQPRKNLLRLLDAFARLGPVGVRTEAGHTLPPPTLVLAGRPGWLAEPILARARQADVRDRVRVLGYVEDEDLTALLQGALALLFPSLYEGFGFPVLEAQALGVPVLTSTTSSLPEVADDAALLVPPQDVDALVAGMRRLAEDPHLRRALIRRGLANVRRFSWERSAQTVLDHLQRMVSRPRSVHPAPAPPSVRLERVNILGVGVDRLTFDQALDALTAVIRAGKKGYVVTANPEIIMQGYRDPAYRNVLNRALMAWPDGVGVLWAARVLGKPIPERVTGSDGIERIAEQAAREGWRLYLLGAGPGVAAKAAQVLRQRYPGVTIVGAEPGDPSPAWDAALVARINAVRPDILFVAYGAPKQEWWIARNLPRLDVHVAIGVGGAFDFLAGVQKRAPRWIRRAGLEWLWRLLWQPWRWRRQRVLPLFVWLVLRQRWQERKASGGSLASP